jgi:hypothetical protein
MPSLFEKSARALPELWVLDDSQFDQAWALIQAEIEPPAPAGDEGDTESSDA